MKRFLALIMTGIMLLSSNVLGAIDIFYDDEQIAYTDRTPVIINDRTYVPIRDVFEKLGYTVVWDDTTKTVYICNEYYEIFVNTQTNYYLGYDLSLDTNCFELTDKIQLVNGRTMLPLRQILEAMNYKLEWNADSKSSVITDENDYAEMDKVYDEIMGVCKQYKNLISEPDEEKEINSLTQEEMTFIDEINKLELGDLNAVENSLDTVSKMSCPDSLKQFKKEYITAIKNYMEYILKCAEEINNTMGTANVIKGTGITQNIIKLNQLNISIKNDLELFVPFNNLIEYAKENNIYLSYTLTDE